MVRRRLVIRNKSGFALVSTLMLMILLTIVAMGLLTLSSISLRTTGLGSSQALARSNARLAMMMALGDLQKYAGPDQRVTANASMLATSDGAAVANKAWTGVWRTDGLATDQPGTKIISPGSTGYQDSRSGPGFDAKKQAISWLVSGSGVDPIIALQEADSVELRKGDKPVRAPLIPVNSGGSGRIAYWVSDESTKAKLNLANPYTRELPDLANASSGGYKRLLSPLSSDPAVFFAGTTAPDTEEAAKILSNDQIEISSMAQGGAPSIRERIKQQADDFTVYSRSVLADPVAGGMKADLTAYLEDGAVAAQPGLKGIADPDRIIAAELPNRALSGPKFGMLRNWYGLRNKITGSLKDRAIPEQLPAVTATDSGSITDPGRAFLKPVIQPVMTEAVYYLRHVINTQSTPPRMVELIYPRVVLWNPFNVKLKTSGHIVHFDFRLSHNAKVSWRNAQSGATEEKVFNLDLNFDYNPDKHLAFYVPPTDFDPGESLCFTSSGNPKVAPLAAGNSNLRLNVLSATANPTSLNCFSREWGGGSLLPATFSIASARITYDSNSSIIWNDNRRTQGVTLHSLFGNRSGVTISNLLGRTGPPIVRQISLDNYSRGNNGRWLVGYSPNRLYQLSEATGGGIPPDSLLAFGARFRYLYETYANRVQGKTNNEPWFVSPMIHHNIGAPNIHRWPMDNIFGLAYVNVSAAGISNGSGNGPHIYAYGPLAQARQWSEWLDPEVLPHRTASGKYRTSVFTDASFSTSSSTYPVYDLPSKEVPVVSLGALQHVQLSPFIWHPTQTIGHSLPPPYLPASPAVTSRTAAEEKALWVGKVRFLSDQNYDITGFDKLGGTSPDVMFNDISYEVNHSLWDRYFLSAIPRSGADTAWSGDRWDLSKPLPNPRLVIDSAFSKGGSKSELTSFHRASRSLWLDGGFNVNSTSVKAWESFLRSFRKIDPPSRSGPSGGSDGTSFAGLLIPEAGETSAVSPVDSKFWNAYRKLTDEEINRLAIEITNQVRQRGPFLGVADFVNRRLVLPTDEKRGKHSFGGAIQSAIANTTGINDATQSGWVMPTTLAAAGFQYGADYWGGPISKPEPQNFDFYQTGGVLPTHAEGTGAAAHLNQADILQQIGSALVARGDTFVIRACGESRDAAGKVTARAWCEAVVQRTPEPIEPDTSSGGLNPKLPGTASDFGRAFRIENFRWLHAEDI